MQIHQVLASAAPGDAVTNSALQIRELLRQVGPSDVYAYHRDQRLEDDVKELKSFARRSSPSSDDVIILHVSIGEPELTNFIAHRSERLFVLYHNISPAEPFLAYAPQFAGLLAAGRFELPELADRCELAMADSEFNALELRALGFQNVVVTPLILSTPELLAIEPHEGTVNHLGTFGDEPVILFVGQMLPHKRPDFLLHAYNFLASMILPAAHLVMVGPARLERYRYSLTSLISELALPHAWVTGAIADNELAAFYRGADLFVTASEHEGFCVPLVEAMAFDVPVVARRFAAIPDTVGDAGLLLDPDDSPIVMAEAMAEVLTNRHLRGELVNRGRRRVEAFSPESARKTFLQTLSAAL